jgi:hypothetical protein
MGIDAAHYHPWRGNLGGRFAGAWRGVAAVVRTTLLQLMRVAYWAIYAVGIRNCRLLSSSRTDAIAASAWHAGGMLNTFGFSIEVDDPQDTGYLTSWSNRAVVMILLAFCGSLVVGSDRCTLPFIFHAAWSAAITSSASHAGRPIWLYTVRSP